jgi:hypothetical protein
MTPDKKAQLARGFAEAINRVSGENDSNTPDFILGEYLVDCFEAFNEGIVKRGNWYGRHDSIGGATATPTKLAVPEPKGPLDLLKETP